MLLMTWISSHVRIAFTRGCGGLTACLVWIGLNAQCGPWEVGCGLVELESQCKLDVFS